jgi:hypothetical protein
MKLHLGSDPVKLYIDGQLYHINSVGTTGEHIVASKLELSWMIGIADVEVTRIATRSSDASLGRIYHNDTVYTGDVLSINAIPADGYTAASYISEITVGNSPIKIVINTTDPQSAQLWYDQEIVLPTGDMVAISVESNNGSEIFKFDSDTDLQVLWYTQHRGAADVAIEFLRHESHVPIHLYDHNLYLDEEYQTLLGSGGDKEGEYLMQHSQYLGTLVMGESDSESGELGNCWYLIYDSELKND